MVTIRFNPDSDARLKAGEEFVSNYMPAFLKTTEKLLNLGGGKYFVTKQVRAFIKRRVLNVA